MTAIFAVWNRTGFAVAADQSVAITGSVNGQEQTMWTDVSSKLLTVEGHGIVVAAAGTATLNGIPILRLMDRWAATLQAQLPTVNDYALNLLTWLGDASVPGDWSGDWLMGGRIRRILRSFLVAPESTERMPLSEVESAVAAWTAQESHNFYAKPDYGWIERELASDPTPRREYFLKTLLTFVPPAQGTAVAAERARLASLVEEQFAEVFTKPFDENDPWEAAVRDLLAQYLTQCIDDEGHPISILMIGYGAADWTPSLVTLDVYQHGGGLPRAFVWEATTPEHVWYMPLAQEDQVITLLTGVSRSHRTTLSENLQVGEGGDTILDELIDSRIREMRSKINDLSVKKLEFVARSFVELESLGSFLVEDLPSVGGEVDVVSGTR